MFLLPTRLFLCTAALLGAGAALAQPATESALALSVYSDGKVAPNIALITRSA